MPWIVPSHQAPALLLKAWRPRWFSGLALVLGSLAPDLEFIVPVRRETILGHTVAGQILFTVPVVLALYVLTTDLVIPWLVPYLSRCWHDLAALERPRGRAWWGVVLSAVLGGLTHIVLDGFTHGEASGGWAVPFFPLLSLNVPSPLGPLPVHDLLQIVFTVVLGAAALDAWRRIAGQRLLWSWRNRSPRPVLAASPTGRRRVLRWLTACGALGVAAALFFKPAASAGYALELAAYGFLDGIAGGMLLGAATHRLLHARLRREAALEAATRVRLLQPGAGG
ncbi:MAG TPA: DUF4184 family protein [Vicinamibacteria bacterium]|nr:DUF4184 family protein [Vicinamibacteria bacterium]